MTPKQPIEFRRLSTQGLFIKWSDGTSSELNAKILRENCPCASCREARGEESHQKPVTGGLKKSLKIISSSSAEELRLDKIWSIGNYALGAQWGDGHSTGIYTYEYLQTLANQA